MAKARLRGFKFLCTTDQNYIRHEHAFLCALQAELSTTTRLLELAYNGIHLLACTVGSLFSSDKSALFNASTAMHKSFETAVKMVAPWTKFRKEGSVSKEEAAEMLSAWESAFGKLDSAKVAGEIKRMEAAALEEAKRPRDMRMRTEDGFEII